MTYIELWMVSIKAATPLQISSDNNIVVAVIRHDVPEAQAYLALDNHDFRVMFFISWCGNVLNIEEIISRGPSRANGMEFYLRSFLSR